VASHSTGEVLTAECAETAARIISCGRVADRRRWQLQRLMFDFKLAQYHLSVESSQNVQSKQKVWSSKLENEDSNF